MIPFSFGSLFSGIGGMDLGLEDAGWNCRWQVEVDPFCTEVLERRWPSTVRYEDVHDVDWAGVEKVQLVAGGFPCQPFFSMGYQKGIDDDRWLWPAFAECLRHIRPQCALIENVPALRSWGDGAAFGRVLSDLHGLGYDAEWDTVSACSVGAPHLRRRLFIVAYRRGERRQQEPSGAPGDESQDEAHASEEDHVAIGHVAAYGRSGRWLGEPRVGYLAPRLPSGLVRAANRALGNAIVPAVAEEVARRMLPCPT